MKTLQDLIKQYEEVISRNNEIILRPILKSETRNKCKAHNEILTNIVSDLKNLDGLSVKRNILIDYLTWVDKYTPTSSIINTVNKYLNQLK